MLKYIGIILFSGAVSMYGAYLSGRIREIGKQRKAIIELMYAIMNGIKFGSVPLNEVFIHFSDKALDSCGFTELLKSNYPDSLERAFECDGLIFSQKELELCREFASRCGKSGFADGEIKNCERYISLLEATDKKLTAQESARSTLYTRLGVLCGLFAALILI